MSRGVSAQCATLVPPVVVTPAYEADLAVAELLASLCNTVCFRL